MKKNINNKQRLFEVMYKVTKMPLNENLNNNSEKIYITKTNTDNLFNVKYQTNDENSNNIIINGIIKPINIDGKLIYEFHLNQSDSWDYPTKMYWFSNHDEISKNILHQFNFNGVN